MAEGGNNKDNRSYLNKQNEKSDESTGSDAEETNISSRPDLFNENVLNIERKSSGENLTSNQSELPRREENPFSFKHFLNRDIPSNSNANYQQTGARPKIFSSNRQHSLPAAVSNSNFQNIVTNSEPHRMSSVDNVRTEYPSVLPDFVQDHLVIEQCYLNLDGVNKPDLDNLPDFTLNRPSDNQSQWNNSSNNDNNSDLTFNLTNRRRTPRVVDFPLDLPLSSDITNHTEDSGISGSGSRSCPQSGEVGVSKSLPDFLSDGPIHSSNRLSNNTLSTGNESSADVDVTIQRDLDQRSDNDRLRDEIHLLRQQLHEKNLRIQNLEHDITAIQRQEENYLVALAKSMEQVEGNLNSSTKRVASAENTVSKLKQEIKSLKAEVNQLRKENTMLREHNLGAVGGCGPSTSRDYHSPGNSAATRRIAQELRGAANNAEHSLRNLLTGLNNLRLIADSVENMHRVEERQEFSLSDLEDESGPAL